MTTSLNKTGPLRLTNKSGATVNQGDVVLLGTTTASAFTTTAVVGLTAGVLGVVLDASIANNAVGAVAISGYVPKINLSASASMYYSFYTSGTPGQATAHSVRQAGDFGITLSNGSTPDAYLFGSPIQIIGTSSIPRARYTSAAGTVIPNGTDTVINFPNVIYDPDSQVTVGSSWKFTALVDGVYQVSAALQFGSTTAWDAGTYAELQLWLNDAEYSVMAFHASYDNSVVGAVADTLSLIVGISGEAMIPLSAGDHINIHVYQVTGTTLSLRNSNYYNHVTIARIGDL